MKVALLLFIILALLNCKSYGKSKLKKKGKNGKKNISLGGDFLGDITPLPNSVYNLHIDLNKNYELSSFLLNESERINDTLFLMYKEHSNTMKELQETMDQRQKAIDQLINEMKELKINFFS
ncbi:conserved Plasmodium protein, unknown function [Plasmodium knowlesi strain H]|uniref:Uncharacterized protein n=3 Tax=Plasmodium knowlesi TaxID=5850 RepID=A0A5E7X0V7_PLAKH|nr:conserved Plasmodium protein, unknown function [Plasmodium knowlesi strain H]OTN67205.1 Uncharacterized protein PKNOH_S07460600 [Plasmodium knowlesi]CAA9988731.1 conserved Plasmodium protein, unknown function [Plasmodium knowlesi strain H]SBO21681.1 conserved Plasmodium protein, unknown function [Plasmodium knowlesi strain H]SBO22046.1 conserved Plasmodium protein, unknown function [Plasmodium knowlesi strain H]VVS78205.1 conserved Plasmodium protein, unknown function [Plasmodium knowlesi s